MAPQLSVSVQDYLPISVVTVSGELNVATAPHLRGILSALIDDERTTLVVDTSALEFCNLAGLEALLETRQDTERAGGALRLTGVHGPLKHILDAAHLRGAFEINETPDEALAELMSRST
jgi:anti-sigma B factor antagonist